MASPKNFVTGFNHNVKHAGQALHVQTEDSGEEIAMISTHLFLGGTIVASRRTSYADLRGSSDLAARVRERMEEQHKQMLRDLVHGRFDEKLRGLTGYQPGELAVTPEPPRKATIEPAAATPSAWSTPVDGRAARVTLYDTGVVGAPLKVPPVPPAARPSPPPPPPPAPAPARIRPPPPPPEALSPMPGAMPVAPAPRPRPVLAHLEQPASFGEDLISDRSLDEVILAYLAGESND